ncbi:hypothetical protein SynSYN20_02932 [Synechococcus sp. SYN20]|nr:hypothetical protein SynSYN20_02932 [Synechococcus sp. SYN20]
MIGLFIAAGVGGFMCESCISSLLLWCSKKQGESFWLPLDEAGNLIKEAKS